MRQTIKIARSLQYTCLEPPDVHLAASTGLLHRGQVLGARMGCAVKDNTDI